MTIEDGDVCAPWYQCEYCKIKPSKLKWSKNGYKTCLECFYFNFEEEVH